MNKFISLILIIIVTFGMFFLGIGINSCETKTNQFANYSTKAENDDIYINVQEIELREPSDDSGYEESTFDTYLVVTKKKSLDKISNMYAYLCTQSGDTYNYLQTSSARTISAGSSYTYWRNNLMSFNNSSTSFAYKSISVSDDNVTENDLTPENIYVRITYDISHESDDYATTTSKVLTYKFKYSELKANELSKYEYREVTDGTTITGNEIVDLDFSYDYEYSTSNGGQDRLSLNSVNVLADDIDDDVTVTDFDLNVYGKLASIDENNKKYFGEYVRLFTYKGSFNLLKPSSDIDATRYSYVPTADEMEEIYVSYTLKLSNGETYTSKYMLKVEELPRE